MKKSKISSILKTLLFTTGLATITAATSVEEKQMPIINYTEEDLINNQNFLKELQTISNEYPIFNNQELYELIKEITKTKIPTKKDLEKITTLRIDYLQNTDLSDLKYLPNLTNLTIVGMQNINLEDIKYNIRLSNLSINESKIENTYAIPNSVENIYMFDTKVEDNEFILPYYLKEIRLYSCQFNNPTLKSNEYLTHFEIHGNAFIDLNIFKECLKLRNLHLIHCSNIKNPNILLEIETLESIKIDDYAAIWLTEELFDSLVNKYGISDELNTLKKEIEYLDKIAKKLVPDKNISNEQKTHLLTIYVTNKLTYDQDVKEEINDYEEKIVNYNNMPIKTALENNLAICTNYASLFQALANRVELESYQIYSDIHTWNMIYTWNIIDETEEYTYLDLTFLDNFFEKMNVENPTYICIPINGIDYTKDQTYLANSLPIESMLEELNLGYVGQNSNEILVSYKGKTYILNQKDFTTKMVITLILTLGILLYQKLDTKKSSLKLEK